MNLLKIEYNPYFLVNKNVLCNNRHKNLYIIQLNTDTYLSLSIHTNDSTSGFMGCCHKDCVSTDSVHEYTCCTFNVIEMNISKFGNQINYVMFWTDLKMERNKVL